jgi:hypothetical protein
MGNRPLVGNAKWNQYFGPASASFVQKPWYGGSFNGGMDSWQTFTIGGKTFLHISLEMEPSDAAIFWANGVIAANQGMPTIITTHEYLSFDDDTNRLAIYLDDGYMTGLNYNNAQSIWSKLVAPNDQVFMVLCGHDSSSTDSQGVSKGENLRINNNNFGHAVYQVLSDYEGNTFDSSGAPGVYAGGAGWLRLMTFDTQNGTIHFQTYSSALNQYAGVPGGPTFGLPALMSDFTLPIPDRVFGAFAWKFGVMADTEWTCSTDPAGQNSNHVSVSIINQLNQQFIKQGVKFVIQVGNLTQNGADAGIAVRAAAAQALYDAGIGFFPMRGDRETQAAGNNYGIPGMLGNFPQTRGLSNSFAAYNFSSPTSVSTDLDGLSYSFDYNNLRVLVIDNLATPSRSLTNVGYYYGYSVAQQKDWINGRLSGRGATRHAVVFSYQDLMGENNQDTLFVGYADANPSMQNDFFGSLDYNDVGFYFGGHDLMHQRSLISSPDGLWVVHQVICASDSSKFNTPKPLTDVNWKKQKVRETSISQELFTVGFYICTVDGDRLTVDYYADNHGRWSSDESYPGGGLPSQITPALHFIKKETWGYSLNGKEKLVAQGADYVTTDDSGKAMATGEPGYVGTVGRILAGVNGSTRRDYNSRPFTKVLNTGWAPPDGSASDIFTTWGTADCGSVAGDLIVVSVSFHTVYAPGICLVTRDPKTESWNRAIDYNTANIVNNFVLGSYDARYPLGTYGVDLGSGTAWAVVNYSGEFAVGTPSGKLSWDFNNDKRVDAGDLAILLAAIRAHSTDGRYDLNNDGLIDAADIRWLVLHFSK